VDRTNPFTAAIQEARLQSGMTQRDLSMAMHWKSDAYVSMLEAGRRGVALEELPRLASALRLDAYSLISLYFQVYFPSIYKILMGHGKAKVAAASGSPADDLAAQIGDLPGESRAVVEALVHILSRQAQPSRR
jgi:transcriptional regulator with XRE-family HTH domain